MKQRRIAKRAVAESPPTARTLTAGVAAALYARVRARLCRMFLREFARDAWRTQEPDVDVDAAWSWYHDATCDHVQAAAENWLARARGLTDRRVFRESLADFTNLLVNEAPSTLKSRIVMVFLPAWVWLHAPTATFACLSSNPKLVDRDAIMCRDLVSSPWYRSLGVTWSVRPDVAAVGKWATTAGGERTSRTLSASGIGLHVDFLLCDDPDDPVGVFSPTERERTREQWRAYYNRVNSMDHSVRIVVQQRVHTEDLSAHLLSEDGAWSEARRRGWVHLWIAVEFDPRHACATPLGWRDPRAEVGEVVDSRRFAPDVLAAERKRPLFMAVYNQNPESFEGGMFKRAWLRFWSSGKPAMLERPTGCRTREELPAVPLPEDADWVAVSVDATFGSVSSTASRVGLCAVIGKGAERYVRVDRTRRMGGPEEMTREVVALIEATEARKVLVEKKALGVAVVEQLRRRMREGTLKAVEVVEIDPKGGKEARAAAMQDEVAAGLLFVEDGAEWLVGGQDEDDPGFVAEFCAFPGGKHDDRVDMLSQVFTHFAGSLGRARLKSFLSAR